MSLEDGLAEEDWAHWPVSFEAQGLPSGLYFYRVTAGDFAETRRMVLVR